MTAKEVLSRAREVLADGDIEEASLEAELLLRNTLKVSRVQLYSELDRELDLKETETFWARIGRCLNHEPSAYITGYREFYGLDFYVDFSVLIPRPESELLVEKALELAHNYASPVIADIGTGCGAIAISLALSLPQAKIYATDVSTSALKVAQANCRKHRVTDRVNLLAGDMLEPLPELADLIIANLPYVRETGLPLVNTAGCEPRLALDGGLDGLEKIRRLCRQVKDKLYPGGYLLLEIGEGQGEALTAFLHNLFPVASIELVPDFGGIGRVVVLALPSDWKGGS